MGMKMGMDVGERTGTSTVGRRVGSFDVALYLQV